jgi:hypothetical protein
LPSDSRDKDVFTHAFLQTAINADHATGVRCQAALRHTCMAVGDRVMLAGRIGRRMFFVSITGMGAVDA